MARDPNKQVFNDKPTKHFRRTYRKNEVWAGLVVLSLLAAVGSWVAWMGANPDPALYAAAPAQQRRGLENADRGLFPEDLAPAGWREQSLAHFDYDNVYEKINGREGFYKSYGFVGLSFVTYIAPDDPTRGVDIEAYDLGDTANAMGCLSAELGPDRPAEVVGGSLVRVEPNARFLARDKWFLRIVGADDSAQTQAALDHLQAKLTAALPDGELPWAYSLFVGMGVPPGAVQYQAENAFSLSVGERVYLAELDDDGTVVFASATGAGAGQRAAAFRDGFAMLGERRQQARVEWVVDRYMDRASTAVAEGDIVVGVQSAASVEAGATELAAIQAAVVELSDAVLAQALAEVPQEEPDEKKQEGSDPYEDDYE